VDRYKIEAESLFFFSKDFQVVSNNVSKSSLDKIIGAQIVYTESSSFCPPQRELNSANPWLSNI
jgi:hypothetical protein